MANEDQIEELEALRSIFENEFTGKTTVFNPL